MRQQGVQVSVSQALDLAQRFHENGDHVHEAQVYDAILFEIANRGDVNDPTARTAFLAAATLLTAAQIEVEELEKRVAS